MKHTILVAAHRGAHEHEAQNSLAGFQAAIALGCDYIEIDLRTAADGSLRIKHDKLVAGDVLPTFDEVLDLAKGRIGIYLDVKDAMPAAIIGAVERHGMRSQILTYAAFPLQKELVQLRPGWPCLPEAMSVEGTRNVIAALKPPAVALSSQLNSEVIAIARAAGCGVIADRLGKNDNEAAWQAALDAGVTGIQTDKPTALLAWLRAKQLHA
ncbi:MAG: glycerophosphodiester phosphodiesterase family protein [Bryobacterales bacterium]|nr:glycerophosphodiester phosphodiesterase family protein [Bryobacterales bacterium]